ncbi:DNA recombination protein RmuC [Reichenbachiella carrageenanivorans]|uniref:DNA recombination protein RmuC n=1 Tax=Reichenbachiella carrageenanivorans TaxID=2979869 RepID=A0ABY6D3T6_9BACT|nr:DNA recombination protein RmuC [Reichenbachiella carrageenanivorans]UXX80812.1 DNA recombination protein RmuC [Reichenbachiella carrageenanivorans]
METFHFIYLFTGVFLGAGATWLVAKSKFQNAQNGEDQIKAKELEIQLKMEIERSQSLNSNMKDMNDELRAEREKLMQLSNQHSRLESDHKNLQETLETQKEELNQIREKFTAEFKNMANEILEENSKKFATHNKEQVDQLLKPLGEKIMSFEKKVDETNKENIARNSALKEQIAGFKELNQKITKEAENLVKALKGDTKAQGNWGEFILESILEKSGLEKQREYFVQQSFADDEGNRYQPDVVVKLPDDKSIIVDSKVSLIAYERYANTDDKEEKEKQIKAHLISLRAHIKGLSEKNYQSLYDVEGLDFVLLFIPIEPAFSLAVQKDAELFNDAYSKNIVIVSPATLIATLRTIASIWKQEYQNRNAIEIAKEGGNLYDKFVSFTEDIKKVGVQLATTQNTYQEAAKKLYEGKGNLINRAEKMKKLGAKATKNMDQKLLERSGEE